MSAYTSKSPDAHGHYSYDAAETAVWRQLFTGQRAYLEGRACDAFLTGLEALGIGAQAVPQVREVDARLAALTGAGVEGVPALIEQDHFARLLSQRKFPVATFIRRAEDIDYIEEPDIFHEVFGHAPMLTDPDFCRFLEGFGRLALDLPAQDLPYLFRLFWFTVEFGMLEAPLGLRAFGAGICSSPSEARHALEGRPTMRPFDLAQVLRMPYRIDIVQPVYFVLQSFEQLAAQIDRDIPARIAQARAMGDLPAPFDAAA